MSVKGLAGTLRGRRIELGPIRRARYRLLALSLLREPPRLRDRIAALELLDYFFAVLNADLFSSLSNNPALSSSEREFIRECYERLVWSERLSERDVNRLRALVVREFEKRLDDRAGRAAMLILWLIYRSAGGGSGGIAQE